jgi:hypothetical protein
LAPPRLRGLHPARAHLPFPHRPPAPASTASIHCTACFPATLSRYAVLSIAWPTRQLSSFTASYCGHWYSQPPFSACHCAGCPLVATLAVVAVTTTSTSCLATCSGELLYSPFRLDTPYSWPSLRFHIIARHCRTRHGLVLKPAVYLNGSPPANGCVSPPTHRHMEL